MTVAVALVVSLGAVFALGAGPAGAAPVVATPTTTTVPDGALVPSTGLIPGAAPAGTDYATATAQAAQLNLQIAANSKRADILDERFLQARTAVAIAKKQVASLETQINATEDSAGRLRAQIGGRAALLYIGASNQDPINVNVASVQELGAMSQYGSAAAAQDQRLVDRLSRTDQRLRSQNHALQGRLTAAETKQKAADNARRQVAQANAAMVHLLDTTNASVKLLATEMEQQAAADVAAQEQAWFQREALLQAAHPGAAPRAGFGASDPVSGPPGSSPFPAPTAGALLAVSYARAQLGKPYVYAGAGPDVFDCSGLTMMAWKQAGVMMEHGSQSQYDSFPHVPIEQLQPGDLVFFGDTGPTNHHVGMVVAPGLMIDAPHTGAFVELVSYFQPDLVPLGARP